MSDTTYGLMASFGLQFPTNMSESQMGGVGADLSIGPVFGIGPRPQDLQVGAQAYLSGAFVPAQPTAKDHLSQFIEMGAKFPSVELWQTLRLSLLWGNRTASHGRRADEPRNYPVFGGEVILTPFQTQSPNPFVQRLGVRLAYTSNAFTDENGLFTIGVGLSGSQTHEFL